MVNLEYSELDPNITPDFERGDVYLLEDKYGIIEAFLVTDEEDYCVVRLRDGLLMHCDLEEVLGDFKFIKSFKDMRLS